MQIPGISALTGKEAMPNSLLLLTGPAGSGKTMYCKQFFEDGILDRDYCIYVSSSLTNKLFNTQFSKNIPHQDLIQNSKFINPYLYNRSLTEKKSKQNNKLLPTLEEIDTTLTQINRLADDSQTKNTSLTGQRGVRVIVDSLTHLITLFGQDSVLEFINDLSFLLKDNEAMAIFTLTSPLSDEYLNNALSSIFDGIIEMKVEEHDGSLDRGIRLLSIKGYNHKPSWISFKITDNGSLSFADGSSMLTCTLCGKAITGTPILDSEFSFDNKECLQTYKKLTGIYGPNISEIGLPSEVINVNFFFIDIVSLSDPLLPVKKQIEKIGILNKMIGSCDAYFRTKDKKIILPTGDGMAIGFLFNLESPFSLALNFIENFTITIEENVMKT